MIIKINIVRSDKDEQMNSIELNRLDRIRSNRIVSILNTAKYY